RQGSAHAYERERRLQMGERRGGVPRGCLRRLALPDGSLPAHWCPPDSTQIRARPVASQRELRQRACPRLRVDEYPGWPHRPRAGFPYVPGWVERSVLGNFGLWKAVCFLPLIGDPWVEVQMVPVSY